MQVTIQLNYPASVEAVSELLADSDFVTAKAQLLGARPENVAVTGHADAEFSVALRRSIPSDDIPSQARAFIGNRLEIRQAEAWGAMSDDGTRLGTVAVEIVGAPVRLTGTIRLDPVDGGCVQTYSGEVKAAIPLFGSAIESAASDAIRRVLEAERELARQWLADRT